MKRDVTRVQSNHFQCECGDSPPVTARNAYEFEVSCTCGRELVLSWRHDEEPPQFEGPVPPGPPTLPW
jgi:hypothetical protein